jgi:hypothetical protein
VPCSTSSSDATCGTHSQNQLRFDWCLRCEKCAFIYLLLSAWLSEEYIQTVIFPGRENMLRVSMTNADETSLLPPLPPGQEQGRKFYNACTISDPCLIFLSLFGSTGNKPFDCVGTVEEAKAALALTVWRYVLEVEAQKPKDADSSILLKRIELPETLVKLCEYNHFPWYDKAHWLQFPSEEEVLKVYGKL